MDIFTHRPNSCAQHKSPRIRAASFGDGYEQRELNGLNTNLMVFDLSFIDLDLVTGDAIEAFLDAHVIDAFTWTPPRKSSGSYVVDAQYDRAWSADVEDQSTITCRLRQVPA